MRETSRKETYRLFVDRNFEAVTSNYDYYSYQAHGWLSSNILDDIPLYDGRAFYMSTAEMDR